MDVRAVKRRVNASPSPSSSGPCDVTAALSPSSGWPCDITAALNIGWNGSRPSNSLALLLSGTFVRVLAHHLFK